MAWVSKSFSLNLERDKDVLDFLASQRNQSLVIRDALRLMAAKNPPDRKDEVLETLKRIEKLLIQQSELLKKAAFAVEEGEELIELAEVGGKFEIEPEEFYFE
jgi:hypothetical protein